MWEERQEWQRPMRTCEGTQDSGALRVHQPQEGHGLLLGSPPSKALSQFFALRAFKVWDVLILIKSESAECRANLESGLIPPPDTWRVSGKATLQLHKSCSKGCFAFLLLFWVADSSQGKKSPLPFPSHPLSPAHLRAEAAVWSQGGITSLEHPSGFAAFLVNPADNGCRIRRTHGQGEAVTPQGFPLPLVLLSSCISPTSSSLLAGSPSLFPDISESGAPWPSQVIAKA